MKISAILEPLVAAGVDAETILKTVKAWEVQQSDALEQRREADRARQAKKRAGHVMSRDVTVTVSSHARVDEKQNNLETPNVSKKDSSAKPRVDVEAFKARLSPLIDGKRIEAICAVRRKKGATFSEHAGDLLAKALMACPSVDAAADEMILRNWTSVKPEWLSSSRNAGTPHPKPKSEFMQHQDAVQRELDIALGRKRDDEFTGNTLDLEAGNWRAH